MKKPRNNPPIIITRPCSQETYLFHFQTESILPKTAAGLLNGYDARNEKIIFKKFRVKADYAKIKTAVKLKRIRTVPENLRFSSKCKLNTIDFFKWAIENYTGLKQYLPNHITITPTRNHIPSSPAILSIFNPDNTKQLKQEISRLTNLVHKQAIKISTLEDTIKTLSPLAEVGIKYKKEQSQRSSKSRKNC